jgi:hypothetical protein
LARWPRRCRRCRRLCWLCWLCWLSLPLRSAGHLDGQAGTGGAHVACCMAHVAFAYRIASHRIASHRPSVSGTALGQRLKLCSRGAFVVQPSARRSCGLGRGRGWYRHVLWSGSVFQQRKRICTPADYVLLPSRDSHGLPVTRLIPCLMSSRLPNAADLGFALRRGGMPCPPSGSPCQESTHELQKSAIRHPPSARRQPLWCAGPSSGLLDVDILTLLALETVTIVPTWLYTAPPAHRSVTQQHHHTRPEVGQVTAICTYKLATAAPATAGHSSTAIVSSRHVHTQPSPVSETPVSIGCRQPPAKHPETPLGATPAACAPPPVRNNRPKRSSTTAPSIRTQATPASVLFGQ